jgi:hypothetical protein
MTTFKHNHRSGACGLSRRAASALPLPFIVLAALCPHAQAGDFAIAASAYAPAPGQFANNSSFNSPASAVGAPTGGGTLTALAPELQKSVTLGGFGGSIVLRFEPAVSDDPCNPFGLDAIVFGNAFWVSNNPNRRFAEAGIIEISRDDNANGLADDAWYVIPGSHISNAPPSVVPAQQIESQTWDNNAGTSTPPANLLWHPLGAPASYVTSTFGLPALFDVSVLQNPSGTSATREGVWGYADLSPTLLLGDTNADNIIDAPSLTPGEFYTNPDNPFEVGITPGSGGGDAFDIAWAVNRATGAPARLTKFHFLRISSGVNFIAGSLGENSTEVGGTADVRPRAAFYDRTGDGTADVKDIYEWHALRAANSPSADLDGDAQITDRDRRAMQACIRRNEPVDTSTP